MIEIRHTSGGISITGHAHYAEPGQDIVCAAVSVLAQTMIAALEELKTDAIEWKMQLGQIHIKHGNLSPAARTVVDSFFVGFRMIADQYPANVRLSEH